MPLATHSQLPIEPVAETIDRLVERFDNANSLVREEALKAEVEGRAVFWLKAEYHDQRTNLIAEMANAEDLHAAMIEIFGEARETDHPFATPEYVLDRLIPLNRMAAQQMRAEYNRVGTFRTFDELWYRDDTAVMVTAEHMGRLLHGDGERFKQAAE